jgi:hypothetical protein
MPRKYLRRKKLKWLKKKLKLIRPNLPRLVTL